MAPRRAPKVECRTPSNHDGSRPLKPYRCEKPGTIREVIVPDMKEAFRHRLWNNNHKNCRTAHGNRLLDMDTPIEPPVNILEGLPPSVYPRTKREVWTFSHEDWVITGRQLGFSSWSLQTPIQQIRDTWMSLTQTYPVEETD